MHRAAVRIAVLGFFGLAVVGAAAGVPSFVCAWRALAGAAALYVLTILVGRIVVRFLVDALMDHYASLDHGKDGSRES